MTKAPIPWIPLILLVIGIIAFWILPSLNAEVPLKAIPAEANR
jgi:hypothetical protein